MKRILIISFVLSVNLLFAQVPGFKSSAPAPKPQSGGGAPPAIPLEDGIVPFLLLAGVIGYKVIKRKK